MGASKKKTTVGYNYFLGFHLIFCHGPIDKFTEFIMDKRLAWSGSNDGTAGSQFIFNPTLFGGEDKEGGIAGLFETMFGGPTQAASTYLVAKLAGELVPAFRGLFGLVAHQVYVGTSTYLKPIAVRATRIHTRTSQGLAQWYDAKAEVGSVGIEHLSMEEDFSTGLALYTGTSGESVFTVSPDIWGNAISMIGDISTVSATEKTVVPSTFTRIQAKFRLNSLLADDSGIMEFRDSGTGNIAFALLVAREASIDSSRRPYFQYRSAGGSAIALGMGATNTPLSHWCQFELTYDQAAATLRYTVFDLVAGVTHADVTITSVSINSSFDKIIFRTDGGSFTSGGASFCDIKIFDRTVSGDMNPAHIIRECLTDPDWGMGYQDDDIDADAFEAAADTLYAEGMGMSLLWNRQTTIEDFVTTVIKHIDASLYLDRATGKFVLKLIRDDYDYDSLIELDPSNIAKIDNFGRVNTGELTNSVTVRYWDSATNADAPVTVQDIALVQMQQATIAVTIPYPGFTNAAIATRVAQRDLTTLSTPIISCTIYANGDARELNIGDVFKWTWPDYEIDGLAMRVVGVAYGDGKNNQVRLTCTQDIYRLPTVAMMTPDIPILPDPNPPPSIAMRRVAFELPYLEAVQQQGQTTVDSQIATNPDIGYVGIGVGRPSPAHVNALMYTDSGGGYAYADDVNFAPTATLVAALDKETDTFDIANAIELDNAPDGSWVQCNDEIMVKVDYTDPVLTVKRGALDTVPQEHALGAILIFWDTWSGGDATQYSTGESVDIKVTPVTGRGPLLLASAPADTVDIVGRMNMPYAPGQFKINATYYPSSVVIGPITISWVHRDRLLQTGGSYLGMTDAGVGPEPGTTYTIRYYDDTATLIDTESGVTGLASTPYSPPSDGDYTVELEAERDGVVSFQRHTHAFAWLATAPDMRLTEASDRRITEDGDPRRVE